MGRKMKADIAKVNFRIASLKRKLRRHLKALGFTKSDDGSLQINGSGKEIIRALHSAQRNEKLDQASALISKRSSELAKFFANGSDVDPQNIQPVLERVKSGTVESELFRLASLTWSVPVSNGFGRRMRYLVWDGYNEKLIGLIAIGDPVFNLSARDKLIGWNPQARAERLVNVMDAYVLGAVPPYNFLLGGKLVACLVRSRDVYDDFTRAYGNTTGIISEQKKKARLLAVMTSSSMGRSSIYNRLKLGDTQYFESLGYTGGWGHFHIPDRIFMDLRDFLREIDHPYADFHQFGQGPNWRMRTTRAALGALGFKSDMLRHGVKREVFYCKLASNATEILRTGRGRPNLKTLMSAEEVGAQAVARWMLPRSVRRPEYLEWTREEMFSLLGRRRVVSFTQAVASHE